MIINRYWTRLSMNYGDQRKDVLAEVNNTLQDLHNFSHQVKAKSNNIVSFFTGLSLRAGGRGFPPATQSMVPGYFRR